MKIRTAVKTVYENLPWQMRGKIRSMFPSKFAEPLYKKLPFAIPFSLHIDPVNICNFRCMFCPTGDFDLLKKINRPKGIMKYELYEKIIDELSQMCISSNQKVNELHLYKDGEPLINKDFCKMAAYAKSKNVAVSVQTTSNGALLTKECANEIIESGLDLIRVSIEHVDNEGYKSITRNFSDYELIKENVRYLYEEKTRRKSSLLIRTKIVNVDFKDRIIKKFYNDFNPISDLISVNNLMGWSYSDIKDFTLGKKTKRNMGGAGKLRNKIACPEPFRSLAVNFNGQVSVCCVDWSMETIVGDLTKQTLNEIWNGNALKSFRLTHLNNEKENITPCKSCDYLKGFADHLYIDDKLEQLKTIYS